MYYAYSNEEAREADRRTIESGVPVRDLMERAGKSLADAVQGAMHRLGVGDALFVCGGGNNGGDGFVAARMLAERGECVSVLCMADRFSAECDRAKGLYRGEVTGRIPKRRYALVVDCLLGTGLSRPPEGDTAALIDFINASGAYVIACDLPSGLTENGIAFASCVRANETVTMGFMKSALLLSDGADTAGKVSVAEIGISSEGGAQVWEDRDVRAYFPKRKSNVHKGSFGSASVLAGGSISGAAFLSAGACLKSGAGYTRLCVSNRHYAAAVGKLPAAILKEFNAIDGEILSSNCLALGMGSGVSEQLYARLVELLPEYSGTLVLDADALTTIATYGAEILKSKSCNVIVTPHPKEFARLTGKSVKEVLASPLSLAKEFAREYGVTVVLKNNRTVITDGARTAINVTGSPALAKGGSGDVLSGLLAGTCARGVLPYEASCVACYLLGRAGEIAAEQMGEYAPCATDIIDCIPAAMKSLG